MLRGIFRKRLGRLIFLILYQIQIRGNIFARLRKADMRSVRFYRLRHYTVYAAAFDVDIAAGYLLDIAEPAAGFLFGQTLVGARFEMLLNFRACVHPYSVKLVVELKQKIFPVISNHYPLSPFSSLLTLSINSNHSLESLSSSPEPMSVIL